MNILFTVNTYKPHLDGVQFVTSYLAEGLAARGHRVELITYAVKGAAEEETINGVHVIRRDVRTVHMRHLGDKKGYQSYILSRQNEFDAIINPELFTPLPGNRLNTGKTLIKMKNRLSPKR